MDENKGGKEGMSVKDIEGFAKKHRLQIFFILFFILGCLFGLFLWNPAWSVILGAIGAIIGALIPEKITEIAAKRSQFVLRQDRTTQIIIAVVALVLAIFLAPLVYLFIGIHGGKSIAMTASNMGG